MVDSATDVNLADWLADQMAPTDVRIQVTVPAGEIIGATSPAVYALTSGDLTGYAIGVTLIVDGEIQGAGGNATLTTGGVALAATTSLAVVNNGAIRGGGGRGGRGGRGGNGGAGDSVGTWTAWMFADQSPQTLWAMAPNTDYIRWGGTQVASGLSDYHYKHTSSYVYEKGDFVMFAAYRVRRAAPLDGSGGSGGVGGDGQGYGQTAQPGATGSNGTNRGGTGGTGGSGGAWASDGATGATGAAGLYYSNYSSTAQHAGQGGTAGGGGGEAISANGVIVDLTGGGILNGAVVLTAP